MDYPTLPVGFQTGHPLEVLVMNLPQWLCPPKFKLGPPEVQNLEMRFGLDGRWTSNAQHAFLVLYLQHAFQRLSSTTLQLA